MINDVTALIPQPASPARTRPADDGAAASFTQAFARANENRPRSESQPAAAPPARKADGQSKSDQGKQPEKPAAQAQPATAAPAGQAADDHQTDTKPAVASDPASDADAATAQAAPADAGSAVPATANPPASDAGIVAQAVAAILALTQAIDPTAQAAAGATLAVASVLASGTAAQVTDGGVAPGQKPARDTRAAGIAVAATASAEPATAPAAAATFPAAPAVQSETGPVARAKSADAKVPGDAARDATAVLTPAAEAVGPRLLPVTEKPVLDLKAAEHKADATTPAGAGQPQAGPAGQAGAIGTINGLLNQPSVASAPVISTIHAPVNSPAFGQELATQVSTFVANGIERADIIVTPKELGPVRIELTLSGDDARMVFTAAQPDTRQAIEQSAPLLRSMLAEHGVSLGQLDIGHGGASQHNDRTQTSADTAASRRTASAGASAPVASVARTRQGLLDLFA